MAPLPRFEFRRRLRTLDADAFERFVVDLWRARGWTVERMEPLVVEHPTLGDRRRLALLAVPWWRPGVPSSVEAPDADVVIVNRSVHGPAGSVVDAGELHRMVHFAVDPADRDHLVGTHLDRPRSPTGVAASCLPPAGSIRLVTVALVLSVLLAGAAGVTLLSEDDPAPAMEDEGGSAQPETAGEPPETAGRVRETPDTFAATQWPGTAGGYPPGLVARGITDPTALASTHARRVTDQPYELTLTVREFEDGRRVGTYRERIAVQSRWTFVSSIDADGDLRSDHPVLSAVEVYSNGEGLYLHAGGTADPQAALRASPGDVAGLERRVERYLASVLSTNESRVVETTQIGDATLHRVDGTAGRPGGGTENVSATVTAGGTVHAVRSDRAVPGTDRSVVVTMEYAFGPVAVDQPAWVGNDSVTVGRGFPISKR